MGVLSPPFRRRGAALAGVLQREPAGRTPAAVAGVGGGSLKRATSEAAMPAPSGPPSLEMQGGAPFCVYLGGALGEPFAEKWLGEWSTPLVLAQALTCSIFLQGPSQLCLLDSSWECSQGCPRPPEGGMARGGVLRTLGKPEPLQGRKSRTGNTEGVSSQAWFSPLVVLRQITKLPSRL